MRTQPSSPFIRWIYFWIGIIATLAYRVVIILTHVNPIYLEIAWYTGTIGFIIYFYHRYRISEHRAELITKLNLEEKVASADCFTGQDKQAMGYIFSTLRSTKEKWNYIVIFVSSFVALILGVILAL